MLAALALVSLSACSKGSAFQADVGSINFQTTALPPADAGRLYNSIISFSTTGGAALPDRFELSQGVLPPGVALERDRADLDFDGFPDEHGAYTGSARLLGTPREKGSFRFTVKAISTGAGGQSKPALSASMEFTVNVGEGSIAILSPTAAEGTKDPQVPAFPEVVPFVNPANPKAFFSFSFLIAGGSGNIRSSIFAPRELELSVFDKAVVTSADPTSELRQDTDESLTGSAKSPFDNDFSDGGWFVAEAGKKVQVGGFQAPRGAVLYDPDGSGLQPFLQTILDKWFQDPACPVNARRDFADTLGLGGADPTLGAPSPVAFCDYFSPLYKDTDSTVPDAERAKYAFRKDQYVNLFYVPFNPGDLTPLKYRIVVQAVDTKGTLGKADDVIARKSYLVQVQIPAIVIDTVYLPAGQAGVSYNEFVNASGGVPPLSFELEYVDGANDRAITEGDALTKDLFGLELEPKTGQFIGMPRAAAPDLDPATPTPDGPTAELTVRVYAAVMNPVQGGTARVPTGTVGEFDGESGLSDGKSRRGRHKTFQVNFAAPTVPVITNSGLVPGVDGVAYPGDQVRAAGGVPLLAPYPVGFFAANPSATYPSATAGRAYEYDASYVRDASFGPDAGTVDPDRKLPNALQFVTDPALSTNGQISGIPYDRGFHTITFTGVDFFVGTAGTPDATAWRQSFSKQLGLGVGPDAAVYLRGVPTAQGGDPTGLLSASAQMGEARMVPLFTAAGFYTVATGEVPQRNTALPAKVDFLPVMLANGGSDAHVDKSIPSVSGFWPAESNRNDMFEYYYYGNTDPYQGFKHFQQEHTWIQTPTSQQYRVFLWAETKLKTFTNGATSTNESHRYQIVDPAGKRGVLILNPLTGRYWAPAILSNASTAHGRQFGAEDVWGTSAYCITDASYSDTYAYLYGYIYGGTYNRYYTYPQYCTGDREARLGGCGSFIETPESVTNGRTTQGRTGSTVAVSADGLWGATTLPGASGPRFLLWRNDGAPIPPAILAQGHVTSLDGVNDLGATLPSSACIVDVSTFGTDQRYLLSDSLMFVKDGLLFLMEKRLDSIFGFSLVDGHFSSKSVNARTALSAAQGIGPSANSISGQPVPDQDLVLGIKRVGANNTQFSFTGNRPAAGEEGPDKVAFIAGALYNLNPFIESYSANTYYRLSSDTVRKGYGQGITGNKAVLFLEMGTYPTGLDLGSAGTVIKDLSGSSNVIYGDFQTAGRHGEEFDTLTVSPDGKYAAVVRNVSGTPSSPGAGPGMLVSTYYSYNATYETLSTSTNTTTNYYNSTDDVLLFSTDNSDLDTASGNQTVLFLGTGIMGPIPSSIAADGVAYASAQAYLTAQARRIAGLTFSDDSRSLIFTYQGNSSYNPKYFGSAYGYTINASSRSTTYNAAAVRMSVQWQFRTSAGGPINFASSPGSFLFNMLNGLSGVGAIGPTSPPFADTSAADQQFWATFKSPNGKFLYYISDPYNGRNHMVGFNISGTPINGHDPFVPFSTHPNTVGFEQFDCNAWNYEGRFAASPSGAFFNGRDGSGIVFVAASDATAGPLSATDLEVYVFDANIGGSMIALTSGVTTGTANAINRIYVSTDGNIMACQRCPTAADGGASRALLNGNNDLVVVNNVHEVLAGGAPNAFVLSAGKSHGTAVAFVGEGTAAGPQAIIFSVAASGGNQTWDDRQLMSAALVPGAIPTTLDSTQSHYVVLAGKRTLDDDYLTSN